jgi:DNA-binding PadR family transcriptional regulator
MQRTDLRSLLETIGVSLIARDVQVLGALLKLQSENMTGSTVDQLREKVNEESEKRFTKTWIYKCLSNLEEEGFITVNRIETPNTYSAGLETIGKALRKNVLEKRTKLEEDIQELENDIQFLKTLSSDYLAESLIESMTGINLETTTRVVEGLQNVRSAIISELTENVGEGDILRATERGDILDLHGRESGIVESRIIQAINDGLEVRVIFKDNPLPEEPSINELISYILKEKAALVESFLSGRLLARVAGDATPSYRMLSLNKEKMLLFLTDAPRPDSVALITNQANAKLLDDAIDAFDSAWENATDLTQGFIDTFKKLVTK